MLAPFARFGLSVLLLGSTLHGQSPAGWPTYGGDAGGQRFSPAAQINAKTIAKLQPAWTYHTHALESANHNVAHSDFEATPVVFKDTLYFATPFDRVIALEPDSGKERWTYDPHIADDLLAANYTSRAVASWAGPAAGSGPCQDRIFLGTLDARLIALDAATGARCAGFGVNGEVDLKRGVPTNPRAPYRFFGNTSPPTVVGNVVVVGSAVGDNQAVDVEPGLVRGFDAGTGKLRWTWDAMPWARQQALRTGGGNAWGVIAADLEHGLIYVPTGSPSPDFFGGLRPGNNADANSIVAIDAASGRKVWAFQLVHHDVWDYDVASEPLLFNYRGTTPAVAIASKIGILFVFNRLTGEPLYPIEERPVPKSEIPGELLSPTQPFTALPPLSRQSFQPAELAGHSPIDTASCMERLKKLRYEGIYTPPGLSGTLQFPGSLGGVNWGSMAFDPTSGVLYANTNGSAYEIRLLPQEATGWRRRWMHHRRGVLASTAMLLLALALLVRRRKGVAVVMVVAACGVAGALVYPRFEGPPTGSAQPNSSRKKFINSPDASGEISPQVGTPYRILRRVLQDENGRPCTLPPWGKTIAVNLNTGTFVWERPNGTMVPGQQTGTVGFGAPMLTAGGLLFTAASQEPILRARDARTGEEVWKGALPVPAQSTPMTYESHGRQFVVIAAGGHGGLGTPLSDSLVAFALNGGTKGR